MKGRTNRTATKRSFTVLVVDDHRVFAEVLAQRLRGEAQVMAADVAFSLAEAKAMSAQRLPDVVLLDPDLDGEDGLDLMGHLDTLPGTSRVLVVADDSEPGAVVRGLVQGAHGWITKDAPFEDLLDAITVVQRGHLHLPVVAWGPVVLELLAQRNARSVQEEFVGNLTDRQREILRCLVSGMTRAEIAVQLKVSPHTVRTHVRDMFHVIGVHSTPDLVAQARTAGVQGVHRQRNPA